MSNDREKLINKVQALLDKAASTGFTAEAEAFRAKADELMIKHIIGEQELRLARPVSDREKPTAKRIKVCEGGNPLKMQLIDLCSYVASYTGCKLVYHGGEKMRWSLDVTVYGFATDIDYFQLLFVSLQSQMANELEPKRPSDDLSDFEKLDAVRACGVPWRRAFEIIGWDLTHGNKVMLAYRKARPGAKNVPPMTFIRSFAEGFTREVGHRLAQLKRDREQSTLTKSTALVLVDRKAEVDEFYTEATEGLRPLKTAQQSIVSSNYARGREAGAKARLGTSEVSGRRSELS